MAELADGLEILRRELSLKQTLSLIERTARWVSPETFKRLPVWYPEHHRRGLFYKANWSEPQLNTNRQTRQSTHKHEGNLYANKALTHALGLRSAMRPNWSCCHIWGLDDSTYATTNLVVQDARFYSCVANLVLLPTPLKAFTDVMPEVKAMLRACAANLYEWQCDHPELAPVDVTAIVADPAYPESWPRFPGAGIPLGTVAINDRIKRDIDKRIDTIRNDLKDAGPFYPREQVRAVLGYWNLTI